MPSLHVEVLELTQLCKECGLASAKAVVACERVLQRRFPKAERKLERPRATRAVQRLKAMRSRLSELSEVVFGLILPCYCPRSAWRGKAGLRKECRYVFWAILEWSMVQTSTGT